MKGIHMTFSLSGRNKWLVFLLTIVVQIGALAYVGWRWHNISVDGIPYQWRCLPRLETSAFGTDYVRVVFPDNTAKWLDDAPPDIQEKVYVYISHDESGLMQIEGASAEKPGVGGDYMEATVLSYDGGSVQFGVAFDRYRIAPELTEGIYNISSTDNVVASIRMKKGQGVIEGIFVNGIPLEECSDGAAMEAARAKWEREKAEGALPSLKKPRIVEPNMVPPIEE